MTGDEKMSSKKTFTKRTSIFLAAIIILSSLLCGCSAYSRNIEESTAIERYSGKSSVTGKPQTAIEGYTGVAANSKFSMYVNEENLDILLVDNETKTEWHSIPKDWEEDQYAKGATKAYIPSALVMEIFDLNRQTTNISSYTECVKKGAFELKMTDDGFRVDYNFEKYEIKISLCYHLTDKGFYITIPNDSIVDNVDIVTEKEDKTTKEKYTETKNYKLGKFSLHPYFSAAEIGSEGYIFIPEGTGALIDFIQTPSTQSQQAGVVYGYDNAIEIPSMPMPTTQYYMPVFGMNNGDRGFVAIIGNTSDYVARIVSGVAGQSSNYYRVFSKLTYRDTHIITLYKGQYDERYLNDISTKPTSCDYYVEYILLNEGENNYVEMAKQYREYLLETGQMKDNEIDGLTMNLSLLGAIRKKISIIGVPVEVTSDFTKYSEAVDILSELKDKGVDSINVIYRGANSDGYKYEKLGSFSPVGVLGGKSGFNSLLNYLNDNSGVSLSIESELIDVYRDGGSFSKTRDAVRQLDNSYLLQRIWNPITLEAQRGSRRYYLISPSSLLKIAETLNGSLPENVDFSIAEIGTKVFSQFKKSDFTPRDSAGKAWENTLAMLAKNNKNVIINGGNAYVLPYATTLIDLPDSACLTDMESETVPFYQLVVHGYVAYTFGSGNSRSGSIKEFLRMVEYGAMPYWQWGASESSELKNTQYNSNYSVYYKDWIDQAVEEYLKIKDLYDDISDESIENHEQIAEGVYKTTYANGTAVIVNYNETDYSANGVQVKALDFTVTGRGE